MGHVGAIILTGGRRIASTWASSTHNNLTETAGPGNILFAHETIFFCKRYAGFYVFRTLAILKARLLGITTPKLYYGEANIHLCRSHLQSRKQHYSSKYVVFHRVIQRDFCKNLSLDLELGKAQVPLVVQRFLIPCKVRLRDLPL